MNNPIRILSLVAFLVLTHCVNTAQAGSPTPKVDFDTPLYHAKLDNAGNLASFIVKPFGDDLILPSYTRKGAAMANRGGLVFGPIGQTPASAKLVTTATATGGFLTTDPAGLVLPKGLEVERSYRFDERSYAFDVTLVLRNSTDKTMPLSSTMGDLAFWIGPILPAEARSIQEVIGFRPPETVETLKPTAELQHAASGLKWIGARESYYTAIIDEKSGRGTYLYATTEYEESKGHERHALILGFKYQYPDLRSKEQVALEFRVYLGPKVEAFLEQAAYSKMFNNWDGFTGGIGKMMFRGLQFLYRVTGSYGIAILLLTLAVKLILHPVNLKQLRSMQKLQVLQPKLQDLKKKYPDAREFQQEVQKLYIEHNVNPLGGCLPILFQIPIFIALYSSLMGAIELKKVPFLWLPDLAKPDPWALLPILFAGSVYYSSKMTSQNAPVDKTQQSVMQIMPVMMLMLMVNVPAGVMIYLAGQSLLSMVETRYNQATLKKEEEAASEAKQTRKKKRKQGDGA